MAYVHAPEQPRSLDPGIVWPSNGSSTPTTVGDPFGERTFTAHASGIDFHRGLDLLDDIDGEGQSAGTGGAPVYSPIHGAVIRAFYGFFQFDDDGNMDQLTEVDPNSKATFARSDSNLVITGKNDGTVTFPSGIAQLQKTQNFDADTGGNDWTMEFKLASSIAGVSGKLVMGIYDAANSEYVCLEYDGSTYTVKGKDSAGVMAADGTTAAQSGKLWGRIFFDQSAGKVYWQWSTDGTTWSEIVALGNAFVPTAPATWKAFVGWDPAAAGGDDTVNVDHWGSGDASSINRFGNWIEIGNSDAKWCLMHFRHMEVGLGDFVRPGDQIGLTGKTGWDQNSGRILQNHVHVEYIANNAFIYDNDDPVNNLAAALLPRTSTTVNVAVVRDTAMDPNTGLINCHRLTITVQRGTMQNFQLNEFRLVGDLATRTVNWNTRAGLDPSDHDANNYDGVYFQPVAFNEDSTEYQIKLYFAMTTVGTSFVSSYVKDADGNTIWSE